MAEMLQVSFETIASSLDRIRPASASIRMCVSRTSMPADTRRQQVALDADPRFETAHQRGRLGRGGKHFRDRSAVLGDQEAFRADLVEQREAPCLEFRRADSFHLQSLHVTTFYVHIETADLEPTGRPDGLHYIY